jgi:hypothetical protein
MATLPPLENESREVKDWLQTHAALIKKRDAKKQEHLDAKAREKGIDKDHTARIEAVRTGQNIAPSDTPSADQTYSDWSDLYEAEVEHRRLQRPIFHRAFRDYTIKHIKPVEDAALKRLATALCEAHAAHVEYSQNRNQLNGLGIEPVGLNRIAIDDMFGLANSKQGPLAELLHDLVAANALSKLPKEFN